jgi:hypothetical protein
MAIIPRTTTSDIREAAVRRIFVTVIASLVVSGGFLAVRVSSGPEAPRDDESIPDVQLVVEGKVVSKAVRNVKGHPQIRFSGNSEEASQQAMVAQTDRYRAEFDVQVDRWIEGQGPTRIVVVQGVAFEEGTETSASTDWSTREPFDVVEEGASYRFVISVDKWFKGNYYLLWTPDGSIQPVGGATVTRTQVDPSGCEPACIAPQV